MILYVHTHHPAYDHDAASPHFNQIPSLLEQYGEVVESEIVVPFGDFGQPQWVVVEASLDRELPLMMIGYAFAKGVPTIRLGRRFASFHLIYNASLDYFDASFWDLDDLNRVFAETIGDKKPAQ